MNLLAQYCIASALLALLGMVVAFGMVRLAANLLIFLLGLGACAFVLYSVLSGEWSDWPTVCTGGFVTGLCAALLCLPALPFSNFYRKGK